MKIANLNATTTSFRKRREDVGLTQRQMAFLLGMPYWTYYSIETGRQQITVEQTVRTDGAFSVVENMKKSGILPSEIPSAKDNRS